MTHTAEVGHDTRQCRVHSSIYNNGKELDQGGIGVQGSQHSVDTPCMLVGRARIESLLTTEMTNNFNCTRVAMLFMKRAYWALLD